MNDELIKLYDEQLKKLKQLEGSIDNIDGTHLMQVWEEDYLNSKYKILFIGREANGWMGDFNLDLNDCLKRYEEFELCKNGTYSTIWQYIYNTVNIVMPESIGQKNFLWTNVSKFCKAVEGTAIEFEDFKLLHDNFNVLKREIEITKPDVVIFFTGSRWDEKIQYLFKDKIIFNPMFEDIDVNDLAKIEGKSFPSKTYRVGHPQRMQIEKKWYIMEKIIEDIKYN